MFAGTGVQVESPYNNIDWQGMQQYKTALHVHTNASDGVDNVLDMLSVYKNQGFTVMAVTDHNILGSKYITEFESGLLIDGTAEVSLRTQDIVTLWSNRLAPLGSSREEIINFIGEEKGLAFLPHPGRYTGGSFGGQEGAAASSDAGVVQSYAELFNRHSHLLGIEVYNSFDRDTVSDRLLWDNILMSAERPVWGFANDDAHYKETAGFSWQVLLLDGLSEAAVRTALEKGQFYLVSRIDNSLGINTFSADLDLAEVLSQKTPSIQEIAVSGNKITITASDYDYIRWIANGQQIFIGEELDFEICSGFKYVRAEIISSTGIALTQPFKVSH